MHFFVTGYKGFETLLFHEVRQILVENSDFKVKKQYGGVSIEGTLEAAYRVMLYSRLANRVFYPLASFKVDSEQALYEAVKAIDWSQHLKATSTLAVSASLSHSVLTHTQYAALKVKDAIVDDFKEKTGQRPFVDKSQPDLRLHLNVRKQTGELSIDLSGNSLHMRGYRLEHSGAPLKEHLAACLLVQAGWDKKDYNHLIDPMCGSGTFVIEAAMMKANIAPALSREYFGFNSWLQHNEPLWVDLKEQAENAIDVSKIPVMTGYDKDPNAINVSRQNAERAGLSGFMNFEVKSLYKLEPNNENNFIICNPPYDERLQAEEGIANLYSQMGKVFKGFVNSDCHILSGNADLLHRLRLERTSKKPLKNGNLPCVFVELDIKSAQSDTADNKSIWGANNASQDEAQPLLNRINKNLKHLKRWAKRSGVTCYRVYDADLPEFAFALDRYQSAIDPLKEWFHLQEYQAPKNIPEHKAEHRLHIATQAIQNHFNLSDEQLVVKVRQKQKGTLQYEKQDSLGEKITVKEHHADLLVNLTDYLDTGLFLDHRLTRQWVYQNSNQKSVLNLFCYTGSVSVQAALGGAKRVVSADMSQTYLKWARENLDLNDCADEQQYPTLRADCMDLLEHPIKYLEGEKFDLIFLDPPSFSNSKKMSEIMDIQRDHGQMIQYAVHLLKEGGQLLFSTNKKGFKLNDVLERMYTVQDITAQTVSEDFKRRPKFHQCWLISR